MLTCKNKSAAEHTGQSKSLIDPISGHAEGQQVSPPWPRARITLGVGSSVKWESRPKTQPPCNCNAQHLGS